MRLTEDSRKINLPQPFLEEVVERITSKVPTEAIYVFGSYARGEERPDSDLDIYVVTTEELDSALGYGRIANRELYPLFRERDMAYDVIARASDKFERRSAYFGNIEGVIIREGVRIA